MTKSTETTKRKRPTGAEGAVMTKETVTTLGRDIETVRKALQRLKEHGIENLIRSGYSPTDACTISDRNNEEVPAFERVAKQLIMWEVSHGSRI